MNTIGNLTVVAFFEKLRKFLDQTDSPGGGQSAQPVEGLDTPVGQEFDTRGMANNYFSLRPHISAANHGPNVKRFLAKLPTRLLYHETGNSLTAFEISLLDHARELFEADPHALYLMRTGMLFRRLFDLDGVRIKGYWVRPWVNRSVNPQPTITRKQAEWKLGNFILKLTDTAYMKDQAIGQEEVDWD